MTFDWPTATVIIAAMFLTAMVAIAFINRHKP